MVLATLLLPLLPVGHALFNAIVRQAQRHGSRVLLVGATNYVVAALVNLGLATVRGPVQVSGRTALLGIAGGLTYALTFRTIGASMHRRGLAVPSAVMQLSVVVPLAFSVAWGERPAPVQVVGILLALGALTLLAADRAGDPSPNPLLGAAKRLTTASTPQPYRGGGVFWSHPSPRRRGDGGEVDPDAGTGQGGLAGASPIAAGRPAGAPLLLVLALLFLLQGGAGLAPKAFAELCPPGESHLFLALLFGTAALTFLPQWLGPLRPRRLDLAWGAALGLTNAGANLLTVYVLGQLPGIVVFPVMTAGALVITSGLGLVAWREPVGQWGRVGMVVALGAVLLVSIGG